MSPDIIPLVFHTPVPEPEPEPIPQLVAGLRPGRVLATDLDPETALEIAEAVAQKMRYRRGFDDLMRGILSDLAHMGFTAADLGMQTADEHGRLAGEG